MKTLDLQAEELSLPPEQSFLAPQLAPLVYDIN
jgi:hypothetical protein